MASAAIESRAAVFTVAGLFAGIGGLELGFHQIGARTELLCEKWDPARAVLEERFPGADLHGDISNLKELPPTDVVTAGFPCTDLSQAGRTAGIHGRESGLVKYLLNLLDNAQPRWVVIENVRNMLVLDGGNAMDYLVNKLEELQYRWAYRLVDSRFTGVPQRRQRVLLVASREEDPRTVLFADDAGEPDNAQLRADAYGFYWTEGLTGLGWAKDAVPTLKGGSGPAFHPLRPCGYGTVSQETPSLRRASPMRNISRVSPEAGPSPRPPLGVSVPGGNLSGMLSR